MDPKEKELEERIETLNERRTLFLTLGIIALVLGGVMTIFTNFFNIPYEDSAIKVVLPIISSSTGVELIAGGVTLLILRNVIFGRKLKRAEMDLNDLKATKKEIEVKE